MIRAAARDDAEAIAALDGLLFPDNCFNECTVRIELAAGLGWVWDTEGFLKGFMLVRPTEEMIDIIRLGVHPHWQGVGIGRLLLEELGCAGPLMLTVRTDNHIARRLYQRMGFRPIGWVPEPSALIFKK